MLPRQFYAYTLHVNLPERGEILEREFESGECYMSNDVVLSMRDISKTFPGVKALQHVDFTLRKGEIHALGERTEPASPH